MKMCNTNVRNHIGSGRWTCKADTVESLIPFLLSARPAIRPPAMLFKYLHPCSGSRDAMTWPIAQAAMGLRLAWVSLTLEQIMECWTSREKSAQERERQSRQDKPDQDGTTTQHASR